MAGLSFSSKSAPKSEIQRKSFTQRLSAIFGWRSIDKEKATTEFEKNSGLRFVKVDVGNSAFQIKHAALGNIFKNQKLSSNVNRLFNAYLDETAFTYSDIEERQKRLSELRFAVSNDPFLKRACQLVADEATQLDDQDRLITVTAENVLFANRCYELFAQWGITQQRIAAVCKNLEMYGEALWAHRIGYKGIEKIIPLSVFSLSERLEFSAQHMSEVMAQIKNGDGMNKSRRSKIEKLMGEINNDKDFINGLNEDYADQFDTKLLGFEMEGGEVVPPWIITHFRYMADDNEFFPYGYPPLLLALPEFKQAFSLKLLQGLARESSFPVQLYSVKQTEGVGVETAFDTVEMVREEYENIGVTPSSNSIEVYTVNTKIWAPEGLLDMKVIESKVDFNYIEDIKNAQNNVAIAAGIPMSYLDMGMGGGESGSVQIASGIALAEQYKPFGRHVYSIQTSFLEELGKLIRLHFAITGEFDYNTPFVLSMRFPAEEASADKRESRAASLDMTQQIMELLQTTLGLEEGETLPEDVIIDIMSKYSFLDTTDIERWVRLSSIVKNANGKGGDDDGGDDDFGGDDMDFGGDDSGGFDLGGDDLGGGDDMGGDEGGDEAPEPEAPEPAQESVNINSDLYYLKTKKHLAEKRKIKEAKRLVEIRQLYEAAGNQIYMTFLKENHMREWTKQISKHSALHEVLVQPIDVHNSMYESFRVLTGKTDKKKLKEKK